MLPTSLELSIEDRGRPCAGAVVKVKIYATRKNNFQSIWGPTDERGSLTIQREALIEEGKKDAEFAMMDFGQPELDFAGQIEISVMKKEAIERALKGYAEYCRYITFRPGYEAMLHDALAACESGQIVSPVISGRAIGEVVTLVFPR